MPLKTISDNVKQAPVTPGKQVRQLKAELEKKDAENENLRSNINDLTKAFDSLKIMKAAPPCDDSTVAKTTTKKKDKNAPVPAKTAYKYYCEYNPKQDPSVDMRQKWKECTPDIRQQFVTMAQADNARYVQQLAAYEEEKKALELYYQKKKQDMAMEFYEAHLAAQNALESAAAANGKKKKTKDPDAPKRPMSSYMYFATETRENVKAIFPEAGVTEITKILAEEWNKLEKGKRGKNGTKKYDDLAAADRARYEIEKAAYEALVAERNAEAEREKAAQLNRDKEEALKLYRASQGATAVISTAPTDDLSVISDITSATTKKPRKKKDPNAPKRALSAYIFFCTENRSSITASMKEGTTQAELMIEMGRQWKELSDKKKAKYVKMSNKDKDRYAKEMEAYNSQK